MSSNTSGSHTFSGVISGNGNYVRNGEGGTSVLSGANTYTGNTTIDAGTLSITSPFLADTADVLFATTASGNPIFNLNFVGTDTIDQLFIDGAAQSTGTWGAVGSGATNQTALITGTGLLLVSAAGSGSGAVPEPATVALTMVAMFVLSGVRRRHG
jgi:autotransporter-associated beta strand protein